MFRSILYTTFALVSSLSAEPTISTVLGTGEAGYSGDGGKATEAQINNPFGVVVGPDGLLYVCDTGNSTVRRILADGTVETIAGTGEAGYSGDGGPATEAQCYEPYEVRFDSNGDLFFVEMQNHIVRKVDMETGVISTVAGTGEQGFGGDGGPAIEARFHRPHSIGFGHDGRLYICDIGNHRIRVVDLDTGVVDSFCGTGKAEGPEDGADISVETPLKGPRALDFDTNGDLWLALREGNQVMRFDFEEGVIHHVAGTGASGFSGNGGPAAEATLSGPKGVSIGPDGNVYLADTESHSVRMIDLSVEPPVLRLIAGTGGKGDGPEGDPLECRMARLHGVYVDSEGRVYIGDSETHRVRVVTP